VLDAPGHLITRLFWRYLKVGKYETCGESIVMHRGPFKKVEIHAGEIVKWSVYPEMVFDVVHIVLKNGDYLVWLDEHNDLLTALRALAASKEVSPDKKGN